MQVNSYAHVIVKRVEHNSHALPHVEVAKHVALRILLRSEPNALCTDRQTDRQTDKKGGEEMRERKVEEGGGGRKQEGKKEVGKG